MADPGTRFLGRGKPGRREQPAHESLSSRATLAEVPLAGPSLSFLERAVTALVSAERSGSRGATAGTGRAGCGTTVPWIVKKRSEDRGNLSDDRSQAGALRLEGRIQSVVTTGRRPQHAIHERQPTFTQTVGIRMPNVKPVPE